MQLLLLAGYNAMLLNSSGIVRISIIVIFILKHPPECSNNGKLPIRVSDKLIMVMIIAMNDYENLAILMHTHTSFNSSKLSELANLASIPLVHSCRGVALFSVLNL